MTWNGFFDTAQKTVESDFDQSKSEQKLLSGMKQFELIFWWCPFKCFQKRANNQWFSNTVWKILVSSSHLNSWTIPLILWLLRFMTIKKVRSFGVINCKDVCASAQVLWSTNLQNWCTLVTWVSVPVQLCGFKSGHLKKILPFLATHEKE